MTACANCGRPAGHDAFACKHCAHAAAANLRTIGNLAPYLDQKRARVTTTWQPLTGYTTTTPPARWRTDNDQTLPIPGARHTPSATTDVTYDPRVRAIEHRVNATLTDLVDRLTTRGVLVSPTQPHNQVRVLLRYVNWMRHQEWGPDEYRTLARLAASLDWLFDRPPARLYLGVCGTNQCTRDLYVERPTDRSPMPATITCPSCRTQVDTRARREKLLAGVDDYCGTAREISHLLRLIAGGDVSVRMIHGYATHGLIAPKGTRPQPDKNGRIRNAHIYRIGEVRDAVAKLARDPETRRRMRREAQTQPSEGHTP